MKKAQTLQEELMMLMPEEPGDAPLEQEKYLIRGTKKVALMIAGLAAQKYGQELEKEQEILAKLADIVSYAYSMESAVLRTEKSISKVGLEKSSQKLLYTQIFCQDSIVKVEQLARECLAAIEDGDMFRMMNSALRKLIRHTPINVIAKKREAAERLIDAERFVV